MKLLGKKGFDLKWKISFLITLILVFLLSYWSYKNRVYDWDMPGYIGCLFQREYPASPEKVHQYTYTSIRKEASPYQFKDISGLVQPNKAVQFFKQDANAFSEQLPYYQIKIGYNIVVLFLYKLGFSPPHSVLLVSIISYFLSGLILFFLFSILFPGKNILFVLLTIGILILPPMRALSNTPVPDMFSLLFLLIFMMGLLRKWERWKMFLVLLCLILIRPDYIVFALTYLVASFGFTYFSENRKIDLNYILQGIFFLALYLFIIKYYHFPGWKDVFYDTFIDRRPLISAQPANFTFSYYLHFLFFKLINFKKISLAVFFIMGLIYYISKDLWIRIFSVFIFANIYLKFMFFPASAESRFFFGYLLMLFLMLCYAVSKKYNGFQLRKIA
ncbi:hypothetical protein MKS83_16250 [Chryseobacterium sp. Y16C]|uniref:hypothetical protein n=1 Tax=Chryseobacterium sp. Y16C TaxID=2920939 RepID=UPI001F0AB72A|nr:hypothetical protein [Chryseobacterium sp. Y16C]UMQ40944.1 hypothetical protein MKS83_16250 [Chryseobacterium sp. Y16C]